MKKLFLLPVVLFIFLISCSSDISFTLNEDGTLTMDGQTLYPLQNSYRYTDYGISDKIGEIEAGDIYAVKGAETVLFVSSKDTKGYYVTEKYKNLDVKLEECKEFFYVPVKDLDENGRIDREYAKSVKHLIGSDAEDFAFYIFYGRTPEELGYSEGKYIGSVFGVMEESEMLVSSYPIYQYDSISYSIVIDGEETVMDTETARLIGIIK
ncbi:MAG: hypothetical protein E7613_05740 [Ruminococcaceae bacterium]|nr:hypothetical protein [Oscillospiraceae bacterium]